MPPSSAAGRHGRRVPLIADMRLGYEVRPLTRTVRRSRGAPTSESVVGSARRRTHAALRRRAGRAGPCTWNRRSRPRRRSIHTGGRPTRSLQRPPQLALEPCDSAPRGSESRPLPHHPEEDHLNIWLLLEATPIRVAGVAPDAIRGYPLTRPPRWERGVAAVAHDPTPNDLNSKRGVPVTVFPGHEAHVAGRAASREEAEASRRPLGPREREGLLGPTMASVRLAVLDLGSTTFQLLVADADEDGSLSPVIRDRVVLNLGMALGPGVPVSSPHARPRPSFGSATSPSARVSTVS